jgi:hypothetical protein
MYVKTLVSEPSIGPQSVGPGDGYETDMNRYEPYLLPPTSNTGDVVVKGTLAPSP